MQEQVITKYYRLGAEVGRRSLGPVFGPYEVGVRLPAGAVEITEQEYEEAVAGHREQAQQWRTAQEAKTAETRARIYTEARTLGFSEEAARALSGHREG